MKKIKYLLLLATLLLLLIGAANATELSEDKTDMGSITGEVVVKNTHTVSDKDAVPQDNKVETNLQTDKKYECNLNENTTKTLNKNTKNTNIKEVSEITNWQQLAKAVNDTKGKTGNITITLGNGTYKTSGTITFNNTKAVITINGNGQTIDGNKQQVFNIMKGASVVFKNMTIKNGETEYGGAVFNNGTLTITQSTITNNAASNQISYGGAVFNNGTLTITQSTITKNTITKSTAINRIGYGGAVFNNGILTITQSTITKNTVDTMVGYGGAIYNKGMLNITQSTFTDNLGVSDGAIYNDYTGKINIIQSTFTDNTASDLLGGAVGGAINNRGMLNITESTLANNTALRGGAIENSGPLTITQSTLSNNRAKLQGGAIFSYTADIKIIDSNFTSNRAQQGAAVYLRNNFNLTGNRFTDNTAGDKNETNYLSRFQNGTLYNNTYKSTSISLKTINIKTKDNKNTYYSGEDVVLNFTIALKHENYYDKDILERLDDITIYVNGKKTATTKYDNYTLSNLQPGIYSVYYNTCKGTSNTVKFTVKPITNWEELSEAVRYAENQTGNVTLKLDKGDYTNTGTINWINPNITLIIDGNGQLLNGNQQQVFHIGSYASMILKNVTIEEAKSEDGAIFNEGTLTITDSVLRNNTATYSGGAIKSTGILNINNCVLANNTANQYGGAISNHRTKLTVADSTFINNHAKTGAAISSYGNSNLTGNTFINNTADNKETIYLYGYWDGHAENNTYESTDIALKNINLCIKDNQKIFNLGEDVVLNYSIALEHPNYYDRDITERLDDITLYINGMENITTMYNNYALSNLETGKYTVYIKTRNIESNNVTFKVTYVTLTTEKTATHLIITAKDCEKKAVNHGTITTNITTASYCPDNNGQVFIPLTMKAGEKWVNISYTDDTSPIKSSTNVTFDMFVPSEKINVTTWDVEMVQGKGVTLSALIYEKNKTVNYGEVYFVIDDKPIMADNGSVLYVPVKDSLAELPYDVPADIGLGNHTLTAVFIKYVTAWNKDDKTLTIIENIPEGAGGKDEIPSENGKHGRYKQYTRPYETIHLTVTAVHEIITDNRVIPADNVLTLAELGEIFNLTFTKGHLLVYIDGELVYNGTVGDDLTTVILEIIDKFLGKHEIKVEFTDADGKTNTYNKTITIE